MTIYLYSENRLLELFKFLNLSFLSHLFRSHMNIKKKTEGRDTMKNIENAPQRPLLERVETNCRFICHIL